MRLVCPNCGAQYEVDDRVMPENGRDVQCSACGHAWFQRGPNALEDADSDAAAAAPSAPEAPVVSTPEEPAHSNNTPEADSEPKPPRRELSSDVQSILQEEAQRELEARQSQQEQIETQTEMGLDEVDEEEAQRQSIRERMARLRGADDEFETTEALPEGRGRDLLPDIEEINSTLDAAQEDQVDPLPEAISPERRATGFRTGFILVLILAALLLLTYVYAPAMAKAVPQLKSPLDGYVILVDQARSSLNAMMESAIQKMQGANGTGG